MRNVSTVAIALLMATWALPGLAQAPAVAAASELCIDGTVKLSEKVAARAGAGGALFVYVREIGRDRGAPTAVKSIKNPTYPQAFRLCERDQMIPTSPSKSLAGRYRVYARHSMSGEPMVQEGWIGSVAGKDGKGVRAGESVTVVVSKALGKSK